MSPYLSVIVPVLGEAERVPGIVRHVRLRALESGLDVELVMVDGDPAGSSLVALNDSDVVSLIAEPCRSGQMNAGARASRGEHLLFLHADTLLPPGAFTRLQQVMDLGFAQAGAYDLEFDDSSWTLRLVAAAARLRSRLERCPYGDQALFFPRAVFFGLGGFPGIPIMEDVELMQLVRRRGLPLCILPDRVITSARRYRRQGVWRCVLRNLRMRTGHALGMRHADLATMYPPHSQESR
ncbi:MAG: TIGR04283 family arsenosugar biosynthesis glycosyltransferase [Desulfovibrionaceae bacterium]